MATVCRRASDPLAVQHLWTAIRFVRAQKQIANEERIIRQVRRENGDSVADTASLQLHLAVADGLIGEYHTHQQKLSTVQQEQAAFRIPDEDPVSIAKDLVLHLLAIYLMKCLLHWHSVCRSVCLSSWQMFQK